MQGLTEPFFEYHSMLQFYRGKKSWSAYSLPENGLFLKNWTTFATKRSVWPSNMLKTVDLGYRLSLLVAWMVRFWFKSFQNSTVHKTLLVQGNLFLLALYMHEVPLCAPSFVAVVKAPRDIVHLERGPHPELYPITLSNWPYNYVHT